jgi:SET domain-containing protein
MRESMLNKFPDESWMSPKVEIFFSPIQGRGMFAKEDIKAGEVVVVWGGSYVSKEEAIKAKKQEGKVVMQLDENVFTVEKPGDDITYYLNHSCDPNVWMENAFTLCARRDIKVNEELTADYILWEADENYIAKWDCSCNSPLCRQKVTGKDWQLPEIQDRYKYHFIPLINKRIENGTKK